MENKRDIQQNDIIEFIPFNVSARAARLIGRENISSSKGAIVELIKNAYDADSPCSIIFFDNKYSQMLNSITEEHFNELIKKGIPQQLLLKIYRRNEHSYEIQDAINNDLKNQFQNEISKLLVLYIIDFGEGMTQEIIRKHWMTIGTNNKESFIYTQTGRIKAGAKGIGRFALDKLGNSCEMTTIFNPDRNKDINVDGTKTEYVGYKWQVNWDDFEIENRTIGSVNAILKGLKLTSISNEIKLHIPMLNLSQFEDKYHDVKYGTILKITNLRDKWDDYEIDNLFADLEVLIPPKEVSIFDVLLFTSQNFNKYGEVFGSVCDDFDYKLVAVANEKQEVEIKIYRNEYDIELMPDDMFLLNDTQKSPYRKKDFQVGSWSIKKTFAQLLPGFERMDIDKILESIGTFNFSFYFLKRTFSTSSANKFFYRKFQANIRKIWLNKFGGIKLFRDDFRVRPYGEVSDAAFDWLGLGNRKAASPAGVAKKEGGYRVEPENIAGAIKISRLDNINFEDKSSREGMQENKTFLVFKQLIIGIINCFEEDRATIARFMDLYDKQKFGGERQKERTDELVKSILANQRNEKQTNPNNNIDDLDKQEKEILANEIEKQEEEIEQLKEEQKVLRGLASSGIVLAAFSHDLSKLNDVLTSRTDNLKNIISEKIYEKEYDTVEDRKNPFSIIEKIRMQDIKIQRWLNFSLGTTRKDKRKRNQLFLKQYFIDLKNDWDVILKSRGINLEISKIEELDFRVFEIDLDSIFSNLLVNSIYSFNFSKENRNREITIVAYIVNNEIIIDYYDNGPGLSKDIIPPEKIFIPMFTTKRNPHTGAEEGTGLGMWIVKSIVEENSGIVKLLYPKLGFGLRIFFPIKYKRNEYV